MAFLALRDTTVKVVDLHQPGAAWDGGDLIESHHETIYQGQVVFEDDIDPSTVDHIMGALEDQESRQHKRVTKLWRVVSDDEAKRIIGQQPGLHTHIPEHETEAQILAEQGHNPPTRAEAIARRSVSPVLEGEEAEAVKTSPGFHHTEHEAQRLHGDVLDAPAQVHEQPEESSDEAKKRLSTRGKRRTAKPKSEDAE